MCSNRFASGYTHVVDQCPISTQRATFPVDLREDRILIPLRVVLRAIFRDWRIVRPRSKHHSMLTDESSLESPIYKLYLSSAIARVRSVHGATAKSGQFRNETFRSQRVNERGRCGRNEYTFLMRDCIARSLLFSCSNHAALPWNFAVSFPLLLSSLCRVVESSRIVPSVRAERASGLRWHST